jgi:hypothetical protein
MTDKELQEAINKAREFMNIASPPGGLLQGSREHTQTILKDLERIQVMRASTATTPTITQMEI